MKEEVHNFCLNEASIFVRLPEDIPKPKSLITSASDNGFPVRRHRQVENSVAVTCELCHLEQRHLCFLLKTKLFEHLNEAGIFPDEDLVLTVPVCGHKLTCVFRPGQVAHLGGKRVREVRGAQHRESYLAASVYRLHWLTRQSIPEPVGGNTLVRFGNFCSRSEPVIQDVL